MRSIRNSTYSWHSLARAMYKSLRTILRLGVLQLRAHGGLLAAPRRASCSTTTSLSVGGLVVSLKHPGPDNALVGRFSLLSLAGKTSDLVDPLSIPDADGGDAFQYGDSSNVGGFSPPDEYPHTILSSRALNQSTSIIRDPCRSRPAARRV